MVPIHPHSQPSLLFFILGIFAVAILKLLRMPANPKLYYGLAITAYFTPISLFFSGQSRYHFPIMPFVLAYLALIGCEIITLKKALRSSITRGPTTA